MREVYNERIIQMNYLSNEYLDVLLIKLNPSYVIIPIRLLYATKIYYESITYYIPHRVYTHPYNISCSNNANHFIKAFYKGRYEVWYEI